MGQEGLRLSDYAYDLPEELIAQTPLKQRDQARLMVVHCSTGKIEHARFADIGRFLPAPSLIVLNHSKVIPARLLGTKPRSGGKVEIFLLKKVDDGPSYEVLMRPTRKIKEGEEVHFDGSKITAKIVDKERRIVRFNRKDFLRQLTTVGHIPLPPYIKRPDTVEDREFYQTVYARTAGSVAAPTAGLHWTRPLMKQLKDAGHEFVQVLLHIGYATFKPVEEADITRHRMHEEEYALSAAVLGKIRQAKDQGRKIVAVGTTSCRVLETIAQTGKRKGITDLFIYPGYSFRSVDVLVTNFHLPFSSLLMLVFAFGSTALMKKAYREAIKEKYRFYSYGDAMVIL